MIEIAVVSGLSFDNPNVYVRNLGPSKLSLESERERDPSLWQVFVGDEEFKVIEVEELGKKDIQLEVYEFVCLKLEGKGVSGLKRVVV